MGKKGGEIDEAGPAARGDGGGGVGRNRRWQSPGWGVRRGEQRSGSFRWPVISKTVNGFIAFGPIPGCRGAASCRPPRSWRPGRRSGRVPAWPYPPPGFLQHTPNHGPRPFTVGSPWSKPGAEGCPENGEARQGSSTRTLTPRRMVGEARCGRTCPIVMLTIKYLYL